MTEHVDVAVLLDNEVIYDICHGSSNIKRPICTNLNMLVAHITFSQTASFCFDGALTVAFYGRGH